MLLLAEDSASIGFAAAALVWLDERQAAHDRLVVVVVVASVEVLLDCGLDLLHGENAYGLFDGRGVRVHVQTGIEVGSGGFLEEAYDVVGVFLGLQWPAFDVDQTGANELIILN